MSDLRARQRELGRQTIVDACANLVTERHHLDFTMREIAERAGVSLRTVYNHFPTREDLLAALGVEFHDQMQLRGSRDVDDVHDLDGLLEAVEANHQSFEALGGISEAFAQMPLADVGVDDQRSDRTAAIVGFMTDAMPDVPDSDANEIALMLRHLLSHRSWFWLTREYGLSTETVTRLTQWAVRTLVDSAATGSLPSSPTTADQIRPTTPGPLEG